MSDSTEIRPEDIADAFWTAPEPLPPLSAPVIAADAVLGELGEPPQLLDAAAMERIRELYRVMVERGVALRDGAKAHGSS